LLYPCKTEIRVGRIVLRHHSVSPLLRLNKIAADRFKSSSVVKYHIGQEIIPAVKFQSPEGLKMKKFLFLLVLSAVARKVIAAVQNNQAAPAEAKANEGLTPSAH
jgi:hypothetical protein